MMLLLLRLVYQVCRPNLIMKASVAYSTCINHCLYADAPLCKYPTETPFCCPCDLDDCLLEYKTWDEAAAGALKHCPDLLGTPVTVAEAYWTADIPRQIAYVVVDSGRVVDKGTRPAGEETSANAAVRNVLPSLC